MTRGAKGGRKAPRRSGPSLTDERRAELGYGRLTLRLPQVALDRLARLAEQAGVSRAALLASWLAPESSPGFPDD